MKIPYTNFNIAFGRSPMQKYGRFNLGTVNQINVNKYSAQTDMEEQVYDTLAKHFSLLEIKYYKEKELKFEEMNDDLAFLLRLRPNSKQTPTEFWHTFFYNLVKYNNAIALPIYKKGILTSIEVLDLSIVSLGFIETNNNTYLVFNDYENGVTKKINYNEVIHVRNKPQSIFTNECYDIPTNDIPRIVNANLTTMLTELEDNFEIGGVFEIGNGNIGSLNNTMLSEENKQSKVDDIKERVKGSKILVVDAGEKFTKLETNFKKNSISDMNDLLDFYYSVYGIPRSIITNSWTYEEFSTFFNSTLLPKITDLEYELNYKLLTKTSITQGKRIKIIISQMSGISFKDKSTFLATMRYQGVLNTNEIRNELGLEPVKDGNEYIGNLNMGSINGSNNLGLDGGGEK